VYVGELLQGDLQLVAHQRIVLDDERFHGGSLIDRGRDRA
jgi:hypothetical protein